MNWSGFFVNVKNRLRAPFKSRKTTEIRMDRINVYSFSCIVEDPEQIPDKEIRDLIALNPWTAVASPPKIHYGKDKNSNMQIDISFGIINMTEGEMIEKEVRAFLQRD